MTITGTLHTALLPAGFAGYTLILPSCPERTCLWLHGYGERAADLLQNYLPEQFAEAHNIAILLPDVPDAYYLDQPWNNCYTQEFLLGELLPFITKNYHLPSAKEQMCIGGISMGGFGSLLLGSRYPDVFSRIISISGAYIINDILIGNPEVVGILPENLKHFQNIFGDLPSLESSESRNPIAAATKTLSYHAMPHIFLTCGKSDMLYNRNLFIKEQLLSLGADVNWHEYPGEHTREAFLPAIADAFSWLADH